MQDGLDIVRCGFATGTLVRTERGQVAVEELAPGDLVDVSGAGRRPVRRLLKGRSAEAKAVRIPADAVEDGKPSRDLRISLDQQVCLRIVSDCLVPASALVHKSTFEEVAAQDETFWQVVLAEDDLLYANDLPMPSGPGIDPSRAEPIADRQFIELVRAILKSRGSKIGWVLDSAPPLDLHVVADGQRIDPAVRELSYRFLLPASASDVWLVSESTIPNDVGVNADQRSLGAALAALRVEDGLGVARSIALDDPLLEVGFHSAESDHRWTDGCAQLSPSFWQDCQEMFFLTVRLSIPALPRYRPPVAG